MADAIFISYRRDDSEGEAGRLFDDLTRAFGNDAVFMDVTGIKPGVDFREVIEDNVAVCGVFLAIVGPVWATIANKDGVRRLDDPRDFVALELSSALGRKVPVIPVLVHNAKMPTADLLPEHLKAFSYRNSVELSHTRWSSDVQLLIQALKPHIAPPPAQLLVTGPQHPGLVGRWKFPVQRIGNSLQRLVISLSGDTLLMHPYGACQPVECDWGIQPVIFADASATSIFRLDPYMEVDGTLTHRLVRIVAVPDSGGLKVNVENTFQNSASGTRNSVFVLSFVPDQ